MHGPHYPAPSKSPCLAPDGPRTPLRNGRLIGGIRSHLVSSNFIVIGPIFRNLFDSAHPQKCAKHQGIRSYLVSSEIIAIGPVFGKSCNAYALGHIRIRPGGTPPGNLECKTGPCIFPRFYMGVRGRKPAL